MIRAHKKSGTNEGSVWKGIAMAFLCQIAYLLFVYELPWAEARTLGFMVFALVQFAYLFPLALFYQRRGEQETSQGVMVMGVLSMFAAVAWFGYAAFHGTLPSLSLVAEL
jgi:hypothetical protein